MNPVMGLLALALLSAEGAAAKPADPAPRERWELTLSEAVRIGLGNAEIVRTLCERVEEDGQVYVTIAPATRAIAPSRFKAETMAMVRSIEQQYWSLTQQQVQQEASARAVETACEILKREQNELQVGRGGNAADIAEAEQRLEQFRLDLVSKNSDAITAECQLRKLLGLSPADRRQIIPVTPPIKMEVKPDWNTCLATMLKEQPDIAQQRMMVCASGLQYLAARSPALLLSSLGLCAKDAALTGDAPQARLTLRKQQAFLQQVLHQTTHSLARFFLETGANYKQLQTASRLRAAAAQRLEAQRTFYEEGRIPVSRYLDAVSQYASAVAQDAQFKTAYNISLTALEEAKGTLLTYRQVTVEDGAPPPAPEAPVVSSTAPGTIDTEVMQTGAESPATPERNVTFDITIGEARPVRIRGTISITAGK
ncbi:MAG: TolC family protein [Isosphaeraceae bacterium]|nr:TolC family protein [Isosphaeraceae bacterium]